jgi:hypothetical protein
MTRALLLLVALPIGLGACGSSGHVIPKAAGDSPLVQSYARLRALGLRVDIRFAGRRTLNVSSLQDPTVERVLPAPGTHVRPGGLVTILAAPGMIASPVAPKSNPGYRVPSFVDRRAAVALKWAKTHGMYWSIPHLPELTASRASQLFDAYRVVAQQPRPGRVLRAEHRNHSGAEQLTPLTLTVRAVG